MAREARAEKMSVQALPSSKTVAEIAAQAGLDRKAENVRILEVGELTSYADYLVLMTATSDRQASAISDAVSEELRKRGVRPIGIEGVGAGNWILIDVGDVIVHVFHEQARGFYDLDGLWSDARAVPVTDAPAQAIA